MTSIFKKKKKICFFSLVLTKDVHGDLYTHTMTHANMIEAMKKERKQFWFLHLGDRDGGLGWLLTGARGGRY